MVGLFCDTRQLLASNFKIPKNPYKNEGSADSYLFLSCVSPCRTQIYLEFGLISPMKQYHFVYPIQSPAFIFHLRKWQKEINVRQNSLVCTCTYVIRDTYMHTSICRCIPRQSISVSVYVQHRQMHTFFLWLEKLMKYISKYPHTYNVYRCICPFDG